MTCRFEIFLIYDVAHVGIASIGLSNDCELKLLNEIEERIASLLHPLGLVEPRLNFLGVRFQLIGEHVVEGFVLLGRTRDGAFETVFHHREAFKHLGRNIESQHRHQHHVEQVNHLLARRYGPFLYCHLP